MAGSSIVPVVFYKDPIAALKFLEAAFGFEVTALVTDAEGRLAHSELAFEGATLSVGGEWEGAMTGAARMRSPASVEGVNTQFIRLALTKDLDGHCERARAAGAVITAEPENQFYGDRTYRALDPEGHLWNFGMAVAAYDAEAAHQKLGLKSATSLQEAGLG